MNEIGDGIVPSLPSSNVLLNKRSTNDKAIIVTNFKETYNGTMAVAGPGFYLGVGAWTLSGSGGRKSLKVLTVEIKFIFSMFGPISIKGRLKMKREAKKRENI